jgi:NTE family protein
MWGSEIRFPTSTPISIEPYFTLNSWDFLNSKEIVFDDQDQTVIDQIDRLLGVNFGVASGNSGKFTGTVGLLNNDDRYGNNDELVSTDTLDLLKLKGIKYGLEYSRNTLNRKQYPSSGGKLNVGINVYQIEEKYTPGNTSAITDHITKDHVWMKAYFNMEQYIQFDRLSLGYSVETVFSNQPFFSNFKGTLINMPAFYPLQDSKTIFLENFRAFNYVAGGLKNVFSLNRNLDFRLEGHIFKPFKQLVQENDQSPGLTEEIEQIYFAGSAAMVYHTRLGPIALNFNYYDDKQNQFGVLLHVGYLLFNRKSLD